MKRAWIGLFASMILTVSVTATDYNIKELSGFDAQIPADWTWKIGSDVHVCWYYPSYSYRYPDGVNIGAFQIYTPSIELDEDMYDVAIERYETNTLGSTKSFESEEYDLQDSTAVRGKYTVEIDKDLYRGEYFVFVRNHKLSGITYVVMDNYKTPEFENDFQDIIDSLTEHYEPTTGEKNALSKAHSYLKVTSFSKSGLKEQLIFEGFSDSEAEYAVNNLDTDWKEQAHQKALSYLKMTSFSKSGLLDQLLFEGFTQEEAEYGVENAYQ